MRDDLLGHIRCVFGAQRPAPLSSTPGKVALDGQSPQVYSRADPTMPVGVPQRGQTPVYSRNSRHVQVDTAVRSGHQPPPHLRRVAYVTSLCIFLF